MARLLLCGLGWWMALPVLAEPWVFGDKIAVTPTDKPGIFQHIDSAGRKNIAVSGDTVAVIWEDNRTGVPQVYVAFKSIGSPAFEPAWRVSDAMPGAHALAAFEPVIVGLARGRFLMGWEQDNGVWVRSGGPNGLDPAIKLSGKEEAGQVTLATGARGSHVAWAQRQGRYRQIMATSIVVHAPNSAVRAAPARPVDRAPPTNEQLYPALAVSAQGVVIAWEDRRDGHTKLLASFAETGKAFGAATELNEVVQKSTEYGSGNGVTRAALASFDADRVGAVWMDKRGFRTGYDVYAARSLDGGRRFGKNEIVQDPFGDNFSQWHVAIGGNAGGVLAAVWDDDRDGSSDILLSWPTLDGWNDNQAVAPASGAGEQTNPAVAIDSRGNLHLVWVDAPGKDQPTRIFYALGKHKETGAPAAVKR